MKVKQIILSALAISMSLTAEEPFVIGRLLGQLGNQMFEVATASAVAWDNGAEAYFPDLGMQSAAYQHILYRCNTQNPDGNVEFTFTTSNYGYSPVQYHPNMEIDGYCQNENYFKHHREKVVALFAPKAKDLKYIQNKYGHLLNQPNTVSIHLRYYTAEKPDEPCFIQYDRRYYEKAMALFPQDSVFIVTSDNLDFARANIPVDGREVHFIENEPFYVDFFIQTLCKNNIIANSTFSWWSAWLNQNPDKVVVRPEIWLGGFPDIGGPDEWIRVGERNLTKRINDKSMN